MHRLWRLFYRLVDSRWAVAGLALAVRLARRLAGERAARLVRGWLGGLNRWPRRTRGWYNLHLSRLRWRVYRRLEPVPAVARRPVFDAPRRIACLGALGASLRFTRKLFEAFPAGGELFIYDIDYPGAEPAGHLAELACGYRRMRRRDDPDYRDSLRRATTALAADRPDLLLVVGYGQEAHDLIARTDTPCIAQVCTSSDLLHHPRVDFHLYGQPEADYFIRGGRLFCGPGRETFASAPVFEDLRFHDPRGLGDEGLPAWSERRPTILFHGSLFKLASEPFLDALFDLLAEDGEVELRFAGRDDGSSLRRIVEHARRRRVADQTRYLGYLGPPPRTADPAGQSPEWRRLVSELSTARLAPDPWPIGGGCSRFEAYAAGVPSVHLGVRFDPASWGRPQSSLLEVLCLQVPQGTAADPAEYRELCRLCLHDEAWAGELIRRQLEVVERCSDAPAWWTRLEEFHHRWRRELTAAARPRLT